MEPVPLGIEEDIQDALDIFCDTSPSPNSTKPDARYTASTTVHQRKRQLFTYRLYHTQEKDLAVTFGPFTHENNQQTPQAAHPDEIITGAPGNKKEASGDRTIHDDSVTSVADAIRSHMHQKTECVQPAHADHAVVLAERDGAHFAGKQVDGKKGPSPCQCPALRLEPHGGASPRHDLAQPRRSPPGRFSATVLEPARGAHPSRHILTSWSTCASASGSWTTSSGYLPLRDRMRKLRHGTLLTWLGYMLLLDEYKLDWTEDRETEATVLTVHRRRRHPPHWHSPQDRRAPLIVDAVRFVVGALPPTTLAMVHRGGPSGPAGRVHIIITKFLPEALQQPARRPSTFGRLPPGRANGHRRQRKTNPQRPPDSGQHAQLRVIEEQRSVGVRHRELQRTSVRLRPLRRHAAGQETPQRAPPSAPSCLHHDERQTTKATPGVAFGSTAARGGTRLFLWRRFSRVPTASLPQRIPSSSARTNGPTTSARASWTALGKIAGFDWTSNSTSSTTSSRPTQRILLLARLLLLGPLTRGASDGTQLGEAPTPTRARVLANAPRYFLKKSGKHATSPAHAEIAHVRTGCFGKTQDCLWQPTGLDPAVPRTCLARDNAHEYDGALLT